MREVLGLAGLFLLEVMIARLTEKVWFSKRREDEHRRMRRFGILFSSSSVVSSLRGRIDMCLFVVFKFRLSVGALQGRDGIASDGEGKSSGIHHHMQIHVKYLDL